MLDYEFFCIISIPIYIIFLIFLIFKKKSINKIILNTFFYFYIIFLLSITIFPIPISGLNEIGITYQGRSNNYVPFLSIFDILLNNNLGFIIKMKQILGNIILFIPMGFLIPLIWKKNYYFKNVLIMGIFCSFFIELLQYMIGLLLGFSYKVTDIDDILLNTLGFIIGFFFYKLFKILFIKYPAKYI